MPMKKLILILFILFISTIGGVVFFAVPFGFHTFTHKLFLQKIEPLKGKINYEAISLSHHQSTFMLPTKKGESDLKVEVSSLTNINPLKNHLKFVLTNTLKPEQTFEFRLYFQLTEAGKLNFLVKVQDLNINSPELTMSSKGLELVFGEFGEDDFPKDKTPEAIELLFNKAITISFTELNMDNKATSIKMKDATLSTSLKEVGKKLSFYASGKLKETATILNNIPQFYTDSNLTFSLGEFNATETIKFMKSFQKDNPVAMNPMFLGMSLMNLIEFPLQLDFSSTAKTQTGDLSFILSASMLNRNIMDKNTFNANLSFVQTQSYFNESFIPMLSHRFISTQVKKYAALNFKRRTTDDMKRKSQVKKVIKKVVEDELSKRKPEYFQLLIDEKIITPEKDHFRLNANMQAGEIALIENTYSISEFIDIPTQLGFKFFGGEDKFKQALLNAGLKL